MATLTGELLVVALVVFAVNLMPAFGPPTWMVLVYFHVVEGLPIPALVLCGAIAATLGRIGVAIAFRHLGARLPSRRRENLEALGTTLSRSRGGWAALLAFFVVSPLPSNAIFAAAGLAQLRLAPLAAAFLVGRLGSYSIYLVASAAVESRIRDVVADGVISPRPIAVGIAGIVAVVAIVLLDWIRIIDGVRAWAARRRGRPAPPSIRARLAPRPPA